MPELLQKAFDLIAHGDPLLAVLLVISAVALYGCVHYMNAYNDLRKNTSATIDQLQTQVREAQAQTGEINSDFSEATNKSADTLQKIADTLTVMAEQLLKK